MWVLSRVRRIKETKTILQKKLANSTKNFDTYQKCECVESFELSNNRSIVS